MEIKYTKILDRESGDDLFRSAVTRDLKITIFD